MRGVYVVLLGTVVWDVVGQPGTTTATASGTGSVTHTSSSSASSTHSTTATASLTLPTPTSTPTPTFSSPVGTHTRPGTTTDSATSTLPSLSLTNTLLTWSTTSTLPSLSLTNTLPTFSTTGSRQVTRTSTLPTGTVSQTPRQPQGGMDDDDDNSAGDILAYFLVALGVVLMLGVLVWICWRYRVCNACCRQSPTPEGDEQGAKAKQPSLPPRNVVQTPLADIPLHPPPHSSPQNPYAGAALPQPSENPAAQSD
eukprot:Hpha_TRINITY_DN24360_c0_g1::TRINITY_DN24360_c0_g1_i1::g.147923::m.147923